MKVFKRSISFLLVLMMILCLIPSAAASRDEYLNCNDAALYLREEMAVREPRIIVKLKTAEEPSQLLLQKLMDQALIHTGNPNEGDYLEKHLGGWNATAQYSKKSNGYELTIIYQVDYYTTAAQEQIVETVISNLLKNWDLSHATEYEKIQKIYQYITASVRYDYANLKKDAYTLKYSAYAALINRTAVCQGYSTLFYRMALATGLDCRIVSGSSRGENHAWNIVKIGNLYYNLDATWDEGAWKYRYFLKGSANFEDHTVGDAYETDSFKRAYPISKTDYDPNAPIPVPEPDPTPDPTPEPTPNPAPVPTPQPTVFPFSDVSVQNYCRLPVAWAVEKNITTGTSATTFSPDQKCTRGQVVTFLWRAAGCPEPQTKTNPFQDVKVKDYYYKAVLWAVERGITTGMSPAKFEPNGICNRAQVATFLWRSAGQPTIGQAQNPFKDVKGNAYYYRAVLWAVEQEVTNGIAAGQFAPDANCTRGQIVTFLYRHFN